MCAEFVSTPVRRQRRSLLVANSTARVLDNTSENKPCLNPQLARYIEACNEEKKKWDDYKDELKAEYNRLKRGKTSDELLGNLNYVDYLDEEDKGFLSELEVTKSQCEQYKKSIDLLTDGYKLMVPELLNQRKRLQQMLNRKKEMCSKAQTDLIKRTESLANL